MEDPRLDQWLWSVRIFKTRAEAAEACRAGKVQIGGHPAKPGRNVHVGEVVTVRSGVLTQTLKVRAMPRSRVAGKLVPEFMEDLTPAAEHERSKQDGIQRALARQTTHGRPTKKDRRDLSRLLGWQ